MAKAPTQETWIEEFLYRGRPSWDERPAEFSVTLGMAMADPLGRRAVQTVGPLTPAEAAAAGYDLSTLVTGLDAAALTDRDAALSARDAALAARKTALEERDATIAERDAALAERDRAIAERDAAVTERDALRAPTEPAETPA